MKSSDWMPLWHVIVIAFAGIGLLVLMRYGLVQIDHFIRS
jgi:hypothetical protein